MHSQMTTKYKNSHICNKSKERPHQVRTRPSAHIWRQAEQYFLAGELMWNSDINKYTIPPITIFAFSCELSLKSSESVTITFNAENVTRTCDMAFEAITPVGIKSAVSGHSLYEIFTNLKLETQNGIAAEFLKIQLGGTENELVPLLKKCSNYFVDSRYSFETVGASFALTDLRALAKGLLEAVKAYGISNESGQQRI